MWQKAKNYYHFGQALFSNVKFGFPGRRLTIIGVTGTSGKTTTSLMIYNILKEAGYKVSVLTSIKAVIGGKEYDTGFHVTTPDPHVLPKYLKKALDNGDTHFVLEVSSHALDQNRVALVKFKAGVLTSFAHEHLDYHKTLANYARAKFKLLHAAEIAVLPHNVLNETLQKEVSYDLLSGKTRTFGLSDGDETQKDWKLSLKLPGNFNILDGLAAATVGKLLKVDKNTIKNALENFSGIPGRVDEVQNDRGFRTLIDFAHKPDALEAVLQVGRELAGEKGRVIVLYGCASERDILKRPIMGEISGRLADVTIITDEDPRHEDPAKIVDEIANGCLKAGAMESPLPQGKAEKFSYNVFYKIPGDRAKAIDFAINTVAQKGDVLLFCGKGHEQSMNYKGVETPWNEHEAVKKALKKD